MAKYLFTASYTREGVTGLLEVGGTHRAGVVDRMVKSVGGTLESFYYTFGGDDIIVIAELPDHFAAAALSLRISSTGTASVSTTVLLDPTVIDDAMNADVDYTPPGT